MSTKWKAESGKGKYSPSRPLPARVPDLRPPTPDPSRRGISLIEVLISMFVLLFGLMGVASMFPVGSYFVQKGDRYDRTAAVGQAAMSDAKTRGLLRPELWRAPTGFTWLNPTAKNYAAIVIDPIGMAELGDQGYGASDARPFPFGAAAINSNYAAQRVSVPDILSVGAPQGIMSKQVAELIFQSQDDVSFAIPDSGDEPTNMLFEDDGGSPAKPLRRAWSGDYSWLITIGPAYADVNYDGVPDIATGNVDHTASPPEVDSGLDLRHDVSVVIFYKRDTLYPVAGAKEFNECEVAATPLSPSFGGGEVNLSHNDPNRLEGARAGEWLLLYGQMPATTSAGTQQWFVQWYKIVAADEAVQNGTQWERIVSLKGPDWPNGLINPRAGIFRGAVAVYTRSMKLEGDSPWALP